MRELKTETVTGVLGTGRNSATGAFRVVAQLAGGSTLGLEFEAGILNGLALALHTHLSQSKQQPRETVQQGQEFTAQPLILDSCQPFSSADGRVGMLLEIEHMKLPVLFPLEGIPAIIQGLSRMLELASERPQPQVK